MNSPPPFVSVVIPTRNRRRWLAEAIASVQAQTCRDWELIIIDDASTDDTAEWLKEITDPRISVRRQPAHKEKSAASNLGLKEARGETVMFLNDDDHLRRRSLEILSAPLRKDGALVAAIGAKWRFREWGDAVRIHHVARPCRRIVWPELLFGWGPVSGENLFRATSIRAVGGFPLALDICEDRHLLLRVARLGPVALQPEIVLEYRAHENQVRPANLGEMRRQVWHEFIATLPAREQPLARRVRVAGDLMEQADAAFANGDYGSSLRIYGRVGQTVPSLARSPIVGPLLRWGLKKSLLGRLGLLPGATRRVVSSQ